MSVGDRRPCLFKLPAETRTALDSLSKLLRISKTEVVIQAVNAKLNKIDGGRILLIGNGAKPAPITEDGGLALIRRNAKPLLRPSERKANK